MGKFRIHPQRSTHRKEKLPHTSSPDVQVMELYTHTNIFLKVSVKTKQPSNVYSLIPRINTQFFCFLAFFLESVLPGQSSVQDHKSRMKCEGNRICASALPPACFLFQSTKQTPRCCIIKLNPAINLFCLHVTVSCTSHHTPIKTWLCFISRWKDPPRHGGSDIIPPAKE